MSDIDSSLAATTPMRHEDLFKAGATFSVDIEKLKLNEEEGEELSEEIDYLSHLMQDEELYSGKESFEELATKMFDLIPDGRIKKFVIRQGYGDKIPDSSKVTIDYNAYFEYNPEPFDSTYARKKSTHFIINDGSVIPGLDIAVQSMKLTEKSQFLVKSSLAYGKMGCCFRIPPDATVLFEVELKASRAVVSEELLEQNKNSFEHTYTYCINLNSKAKEYFNRQQYSSAIRQYNIACDQLESLYLNDYTEQEKQQELLLKLYTNLVICYRKLEKYPQSCTNANKIFRLVMGTLLKVPAKVYYNNAICLRMLGDYKMALMRLKHARHLYPDNDDIEKEFANLHKDEKKALEKEAVLAARMIAATTEKISDSFIDNLKKSCEELKKDDILQVHISSKLTESEKKYAEREVAKLGFCLKTVEKNGKIESYIRKSD